MKITFKQICKFLRDESTDRDKEIIQEKMRLDNYFAKRIAMLELFFRVEKKRVHKKDLDQMWSKMQDRIHEYERSEHKTLHSERAKRSVFAPIFATPRVAVAYGLALLFLLSIPSVYFYQQYNESASVQFSHTYKTIKVKHGERLNIQLPDGSTIHADAGSEIRFSENMKKERAVFLKGEAYFDVAHNPKVPFRVFARHAEIKVLGTRFNVSAWDEMPAVNVAVQNGRVAFTNHFMKTDTVVITKNKYSSVNMSSAPNIPKTGDIKEFTGWMENRKQFSNASLKEILAQLERWYDYKFIVEDETILNKKLTVLLEKPNVNDVIELISILTNTTVVRNQNEIKLQNN